MPRIIRIMIGVDIDEAYRKLIGNGAIASDAQCRAYIQGLIKRDRAVMERK